MKVYKSYTIHSTSETLIGMLSIFPFESFEEQENHIIAYIPEDACDQETQNSITKILEKFDATCEIETIQPQNWNALWEASFEPVLVDDFCIIRADFHSANEGITHDIIINPKMAFGTGHHETTYMMMAAMKNIPHTGKTIFDYGCGTGVLSILASKLGSGPIDAIDIEEESHDNTIENAELNSITNINVACSDLPSFPTKTYDIILANINRNVLLASADDLYRRLESDGVILLSGILEEDEKLVTDCYTNAGFKLIEVFSRGYWKCLKLEK